MSDISGRVRIESETLLSDNHYILKNVSFAWRRGDGTWQSTKREVYDCGDGCTILLYNRGKRTVVLTRQFRMPAYLNGYRDLLTEAAAGLLDGADPESRIVSEAEEETGFTPRNLRKVFECYMAPGAVKQKIHLFVGEYDSTARRGGGGGLEDEGEDIEVLELAFDEAVAMMMDGRICDAKTIMLLQHAQLHVFR
ncbi:MAG TPA: NUDIX domain-containing protein [Rhizomicrobium sp.]|nr:NUDIX domain-containing protein [Rhizomicrobium sp.]